VIEKLAFLYGRYLLLRNFSHLGEVGIDKGIVYIGPWRNRA
jgi:hypothetical protein